MKLQNAYFNRYNFGESDFVSPGKQLEYIASTKPDTAAIISISKVGEVSSITWELLHKSSNRLARLLSERGINSGSTVLVSLPNGIEHIVATYAIWKLGACYLPISNKTSVAELAEICCMATPDIAFSDYECCSATDCIGTDGFFDRLAGYSAEPLADTMAIPNMISLSGGTNGKIKLIRQNIPSGMSDGVIENWFKMSGMDFDQQQLLIGPLFHGAPHTAAFNGLFTGGTLIIPRNLCPDNIVRIIKEYRVEFMQIVPTLMNRMIKLKSLKSEDFESIKAICHTGGFCSAQLKQAWVDILSPERVYEIYSMTEVIGLTCIRGDEWLEHRGSVGRPIQGGKISIRDCEGNTLSAREIGEIFMTPPQNYFCTEYMNHKALEVKDGGFRSVGDIGYVDEDGYLYFSDRRSDMIVTGGENVFAAEVENVLLQHPDILDAVVVGIPDEEWGRRLHAVVEAMRDISKEELSAFLAQYLLPYKIPKTFEFVGLIRRKDNGKIVREKILQDCITRGV